MCRDEIGCVVLMTRIHLLGAKRAKPNQFAFNCVSSTKMLGRKLATRLVAQPSTAPATRSVARSIAILSNEDLKQRQRGFSTLAKGDKVGVVGLGLLGHGFVQLAADVGEMDVVAVDVNEQALQKGMDAIKDSLQKTYSKKLKDDPDAAAKVKAKVDAAMGRIHPSGDVKDLKDTSLVIEAIVENLDIKKKLFAQLGELCQPSTVLASNTSSLPIGQVADASGRPDKVVGIHGFNPLQIMTLMEIVKARKTSDDSVELAMDFTKKINRYPVLCKDTPGFVVNRLLVPYLAQALAMYDRGEASYQDIDEAMKRGAGYPMGPFHLADYVGLDTIHSVLTGWKEAYPKEPAFIVPDCLIELVKKGKLGRKSGEGFYKWEGNKKIN